MFYLKQGLTNKEKWNILVTINEISDIYGEFYLTKNNLRIFIKDNISSLWENLKKGDKVIYGEDGIAIITGFAEKTIKVFNPITKQEEIRKSRKIIKLLAKDEKNADRLLQFINGNFKKLELYTKIKKTNPLLKIFYTNGFEFKGGRGKELLLYRKASLKDDFVFIKEEDNRKLAHKRRK
jgi:hypothetical protein